MGESFYIQDFNLFSSKFHKPQLFKVLQDSCDGNPVQPETDTQFFMGEGQQKMKEGSRIDLQAIAEIICDGMLCYPEVAEIYTEFLIEKRRIPELEALYQKICEETTAETLTLVDQLELSEELCLNEEKLHLLTDTMNTAILGIVILNQYDNYQAARQQLFHSLLSVLSKGGDQSDKSV